MKKQQAKKIGILVQVTRGEVLDWIGNWGVYWYECALSIHDSNSGKEKELAKLVALDRDIRLILTSCPIPPEINLDAYFITEHQRFGYLIFDIGRQTKKGLFESYLTGFMTQDLKLVVEFVKKNTFRGVKDASTGKTIPGHCYTEGAFSLYSQGVPMLDVSGYLLQLGNTPEV